MTPARWVGRSCENGNGRADHIEGRAAGTAGQRSSSGFANQAVIGSVLAGKTVAVVRRWTVINGCLIG